MNSFKVGDFVKTESGEIGVIGWTENKSMDLKEADGYIGISLLTHSRGFKAPVKADKCTKSNIKAVVDFYKAEEARLHDVICQKQINKSELEQLKLENQYLKQLLKLYI